MAENGRIAMLSEELKKLKEVIDRIHPQLAYERVSYNILSSQYGQLVERNAKLEEGIAKSVETSRQIVAEGHEEMKRLKASAGELYARAYSKFKEVENLLEESDRRAVKKHLKELEEIKT